MTTFSIRLLVLVAAVAADVSELLSKRPEDATRFDGADATNYHLHHLGGHSSDCHLSGGHSGVGGFSHSFGGQPGGGHTDTFGSHSPLHGRAGHSYGGHSAPSYNSIEQNYHGFGDTHSSGGLSDHVSSSHLPTNFDSRHYSSSHGGHSSNAFGSHLPPHASAEHFSGHHFSGGHSRDTFASHLPAHIVHSSFGEHLPNAFGSHLPSQGSAAESSVGHLSDVHSAFGGHFSEDVSHSSGGHSLKSHAPVRDGTRHVNDANAGHSSSHHADHEFSGHKPTFGFSGVSGHSSAPHREDADYAFDGEHLLSHHGSGNEFDTKRTSDAEHFSSPSSEGSHHDHVSNGNNHRDSKQGHVISQEFLPPLTSDSSDSSHETSLHSKSSPHNSFVSSHHDVSSHGFSSSDHSEDNYNHESTQSRAHHGNIHKNSHDGPHYAASAPPTFFSSFNSFAPSASVPSYASDSSYYGAASVPSLSYSAGNSYEESSYNNAASGPSPIFASNPYNADLGFSGTLGASSDIVYSSTGGRGYNYPAPHATFLN